MSLLSLLKGEPVATISAMELEGKFKNGKRPFLLDVRQPEEYRLGHIPGARLIPLGSLGSRLDEIPLDREIVCVCATGHRSVPAVRKLTAAGREASSLKNGMIAWQLSKRPVKMGMPE